MQDVTKADNRRGLKFEFLEVAGLRIRFLRRGAGPPLVLLHGWGVSTESFAALIPELDRKHTVVAFDFPGFGKSDLPATAWGVDDYVVITRQLVAALGIERPDVIAHSFGGRVAIKLAAQDPAAIGRLVLVGVPGIRRAPGPKYRAKVLAAKTLKNVARLMPVFNPLSKFVVKRVAARDYLAAGALRGTFVKVVSEDLSVYLPAITSPVLLVWGTNDLEVPIAVAKAMERVIPGAVLAEMPDSGHFCFLEQHDRFRVIVERFLHDKR